MLCGCDYLEPIKGIGAKTALKLVRDYDSFEEILEHLRKGKNPPPEDWPWEAAKELFKKPDVTAADQIDVSQASLHRSIIRLTTVGARQLQWKAPDVEGLVDFLVKDKGFA